MDHMEYFIELEKFCFVPPRRGSPLLIGIRSQYKLSTEEITIQYNGEPSLSFTANVIFYVKHTHTHPTYTCLTTARQTSPVAFLMLYFIVLFTPTHGGRHRFWRKQTCYQQHVVVQDPAEM